MASSVMVRRLVVAASLALCLSGVSALPAGAEIQPRGPLPVRSQFPLDLVTLDMTPESARLPDSGTATLRLLFVRANSFEITPGYDARVTAHDAGTFLPGWDFNVDSETTRASLSAEFQLGRRFALGLEAPMLMHGGGFMDSTIEDFHDAFSLPQNDRELKERDVLNVDLLGGPTRARLVDDEAAFGDLVVRAKVSLWDGASSAWTAVAEAKAPTGEEASFTGSGEWDYGLSLLFSAGSERHVFHGGIGHQVLGQPAAWPFEIEDRTAAFAGYEFSANERWAIVMHVMGATSILPEQADYKQDGARAEIVAGFHWTRGSFTLSAGFVENLLTNDNDSDLGIILGFGWEIGR